MFVFFLSLRHGAASFSAVYQKIPATARVTPSKFHKLKGSPKRRYPEERMTQSLPCPRTLYETGEVRLITRKMDKFTKKASMLETPTHSPVCPVGKLTRPSTGRAMAARRTALVQL